MQTVHETRKARLLMLKKKHGTWAAINKLIGWENTNARLSQIGAGSIRSGRNTPYVMGDEMAREIEAALGLENGWMDTPPSYAEIHGSQDPRATLMAAMESMTMGQISTAAALIQALKQTQHDEKGAV